VFTAPLAPVTPPVQTATCSTGRVPVGGGYELIGPAQALTVLSSAPITAGWRVTLLNETGAAISNAQVRVHVVCAVMQ